MPELQFHEAYHIGPTGPELRIAAKEGALKRIQKYGNAEVENHNIERRLANLAIFFRKCTYRSEEN